MSTFLRLGVLGLLLALTPGVGLGQEAVSVDSLRSWMQQVPNSGCWGERDELGTLNLITPARKQAAAALVTAGRLGS